MIAAVHSGAGTYNEGERSANAKLCGRALKSSSINAAGIVEAVMVLEGDPLTNSGYGSNLTLTGRVENEASYMSSRGMAFGGVAAVSNCIHPVHAAKCLSHSYQSKAEQWELVPPMLLAGGGADAYCRSLGVGVMKEAGAMVAPAAKKQYERAMKRLPPLGTDTDRERLDTVGGVAIHDDGTCEACSSSGGIILKWDGRMGHSSQFGCAVWSEQRESTSVAVTLSGCGEAITRTQLAEKLASAAFDWDEMTLLPKKLSDFLNSRAFLQSPRLINTFPPDRMQVGGLLLIRRRESDFDALLAFHNTAQLPFAFINGDGDGRVTKKVSSKEGAGIVCELFIL